MADPEYYYKIGLSLYDSSKYAEALTYFDNAEREEKDELKLAILSYYKGLAHNKQGIKYDKKQFYKAIECFDKAIILLNKNKDKKHHQDKELDDINTIIPLTEYNWAYACGELQEYEFAKKHYALAIEYFNTDKKLKLELADAYRGIGHVHAQLDEMEEATKCLDKAIDIEPHFAFIYNTKGYVLNLQEK